MTHYHTTLHQVGTKPQGGTHMRFVANTKTFAAALTRVCKAVSARSPLPILQWLLVETDGEHAVTITATDLDLTAVTWVEDVTVLQEGSCLLPAKLSRDTVRSTVSPTLVVSADTDEIKVGTATFRAGPPMDEWPKMQNPFALNRTYAELPANLWDQLAAVSIACSRDDARPILRQVSFEADPKTGLLTLAATDSYRLAVAHTTMQLSKGDEIGMMPLSMIRLIPAVCSRPLMLQTHTGEAGTRYIAVVGETGLLLNRQCEGTFPNWRQLMPALMREPAFRADQADVLAQLKAQQVVAEDHIPVRVTIGDDVTLSTVRQDVGSVNGTIVSADICPAAERFTIAFNSRYLADGIRTMGPGRFELVLVDPLKPGLLRTPAHSIEYLLMPVRL